MTGQPSRVTYERTKRRNRRPTTAVSGVIARRPLVHFPSLRALAAGALSLSVSPFARCSVPSLLFALGYRDCFPLFPIILRNRRSSLWVGGGGRRRHVRRRRPRQRRRCAGVRFLRHCGRVRKRQRLDSAMCNYMLRGVITSALQIIARFRNAVDSLTLTAPLPFLRFYTFTSHIVAHLQHVFTYF